MSGAGLIIFVLWIAVSNLVLGFGLAVFMGHGPNRLPQLSLPFVPRFKLPAFKLRLPSWRKSPAADQEASAPQEVPEQTPNFVTNIPAKTTSAPDDGIPLDEALAQFQLEVAGVHGELNEVKELVQACAASPTVEAVEECVADLKYVSHRILDGRAESLQAIEKSARGSQADQKAVSAVQQAAANQAKDILQTLDEIGLLEIDPGNLEANCEQIKDHTNLLAASCDTMSQSLEAAKSQPGPGSPARQKCPAPELERVEASEALDDWWADDPDHQRPLTMVMIDLDEVGALNKALGETTVDGVLARVAECVLATDIQGGRASQINAQRFLLLLPKVEVPKLTREVELLREQIKSIPVESERNELQLTASCAIAFSRAGDSARALVARAEAALLEAKQFGGNRTFLNEGEFPTPVVSAQRQETAAAV